MMIPIKLPDELVELLEDAVEQAIKAAKEEDDVNYEGWYCIQIKPIKCPGCGDPITHMQPPELHLIIVWKDRNDRHLVWFEKELGKLDMEPYVHTYNPIYGSCIPWEEVKELYGD